MNSEYAYIYCPFFGHWSQTELQAILLRQKCTAIALAAKLTKLEAPHRFHDIVFVAHHPTSTWAQSDTICNHSCSQREQEKPISANLWIQATKTVRRATRHFTRFTIAWGIWRRQVTLSASLPFNSGVKSTIFFDLIDGADRSRQFHTKTATRNKRNAGREEARTTKEEGLWWAHNLSTGWVSAIREWCPMWPRKRLRTTPREPEVLEDCARAHVGIRRCEGETRQKSLHH